ncbi:MAG TPA: 6-phosphogluconolactonase [Sphingomicrobium sp.]|nr:6-phosphogluconolactonase [Sphingomicrobium sp.]
MESIASETVARAECAAAAFIARRLIQAERERGQASLAISGGRSPWGMLDQLAAQAVAWDAVHLFQVDERVAPPGNEARNWGKFLASALARQVPPANWHPMPVEIADPETAADQYASTLAEWTGEPPALDVVHLGIGADGHTASLFSGDASLRETQRPVALSRSYEGFRRLTLTLPVLNRARCVVWFALGAARRAALTRLFNGDTAIPASLVQRDRATCFMDREAAPAN